MNPDLSLLQPYPFEKLNALKAAVQAPADKSSIFLSIGEPKHPAPDFVLESLKHNLQGISIYPKTRGLDELREAAAQWASTRFQLAPGSLSAERHLLPVNGTREALFAFVQAIVDRHAKPLVICPNPFYQIYEGAAYLAGAEPWFLSCTEQTGYLPDFNQVPNSVWQRCQILFLCTPSNPTGAVIDTDKFRSLIKLADQHDFVIASDECYSELYFDERKPPAGLLQACAELGRNDFHRCLVFHSLSKRSNLPGLRSGFVAGDAALIEKFLLYRTYHGCAMPEQVQRASITAWQDETHVAQNRELYRRKFEAVTAILADCMDVRMPSAGFYLWLKTPIEDTDFTQQLFATENVTVLPGQFLSRETAGLNPGKNYARIALVAPYDDCIEAAQRIKRFVNTL